MQAVMPHSYHLWILAARSQGRIQKPKEDLHVCYQLPMLQPVARVLSVRAEFSLSIGGVKYQFQQFKGRDCPTVLSTGETAPRVLHLVLGFSLQKGH